MLQDLWSFSDSCRAGVESTKGLAKWMSMSHTGAEVGAAPAADMEELDMEEGVAEAWGADDGLDLDGVGDVVGEGDGDEEEEGGWEMEARRCPRHRPTLPDCADRALT